MADDPETGVAPAPADIPGADPPAARFAVPVTIALDRQAIPLGRLQAVREGAVLPVEAADGALRVELLAGGRAFARGTLVGVGDGYGVLVDALVSEH
ncbi:hypothetical protein GO308_00305 [Sphingomonas sp. SFZ2018-12]|uniref:FliM/FliN family flagellar motor C-terminal domain-containing protein n=1 Tax=Sphingomonas sp. SFZ2018-12 TaxID=2683197 RepID=UPI001F118481|nr:FliM/FliN family flagellar motor C-terminal domain-containing protein [Sphingomonas sp. SFZ2018-12]MCH4891547.1 hypothetical protein [Sphingomonas sp. SFZ2018-12]